MPSETPTTRRGFLMAAGVGGLAFAGCGDDDSGSASTTSTVAGTGYPKRVRGQLGTITIPERPERVVAVGQYRDQDAAVALGVVPVLSPDLSTFVPGGISPWVKARLNGSVPELFDTADGLPLERVAAQRPDLILATDLLSVQDEYSKLSRIAPTLSPEKSYNKDRWQTTTTRIGAALDREERAADLIADVEAQVRSAKADHPGFAGKSFTFGPVTADGVVNTINSETDASVIFFSELGLRLSKRVTGLKSIAIPGRATVSPERLDLIDADVLILTFNTPEARQKLESSELFQRIPAVRDGRYVALDLPTALALGFPSALSIPYGLRKVVPPVEQALATL